MSLVFVGHRCCDHSPNGGYDQVCTLFPEAGWLDGRELAAGRLTWLREPATHCGSSKAGPEVFHVFYGDCSGSALPAILRNLFPHAVVVSTVHQPIARLMDDPAGWASLRQADGIITVSQAQANELSDVGLAASIHVVPHGVWTRVFRPALDSKDATTVRDRVLFVGNYLRDWNGTARIVEMLAAAGVRSVVLGSAAADRLPVRDSLVELSPRVSEQELAAMYNRSAALVLPVLNATASNALLEAMAAGCPVICPRLPSLVDEYLGDDADAYPPGDYRAAVARALRYVRDPSSRAARSQALMSRAEQFDWARLRPRLAAAYQEIVDRTRVLGGARG
jgi:glycosyltransferase involved in cell wall biosynthesis